MLNLLLSGAGDHSLPDGFRLLLNAHTGVSANAHNIKVTTAKLGEFFQRLIAVLMVSSKNIMACSRDTFWEACWVVFTPTVYIV